MRERTIMLPLLTAVLLAFAGCSDDTTPSGTGTTTPPDTTSPTSSPTGAPPTVQITAPAAGTTVPAGAVTVTATVANFNVVNKLGEAAVPGEGHVHFYVDVAQPPTDPNQAAVTAEGTYHASATLTYSWPDVKAGTHSFAVQLVNNDHKPLNPPVLATVTVTVT